MKKLTLILSCLIFLLPANAFAAGYKQGDVLLNISVTTAYPLLGSWRGEYDVIDQTNGIKHDAKLGDWSIGGDLNLSYFFSPHFSAGLHVSDNDFPDRIASGVERNVGTYIVNTMFLMRYYFNPEDKIKVYIPAAIGAAFITARIEMDKKERFTDTGFAFHIGIGAEYYFNDKYGVALETRYNHNTFNSKKTTGKGYRIWLHPRANYESLVLRLFRKF